MSPMVRLIMNDAPTGRGHDGRRVGEEGAKVACEGGGDEAAQRGKPDSGADADGPRREGCGDRADCDG